MYPKQFENEYYGDNIRWFIGIAESGSDEDPMGLRRVRVRVFGLHSPEKEDIDTSDLPWAQVMISGTEDAIPQYGMPPSIKAGAMVFGIFLDGKASQVPLVLGSLPRLRMPNLIPGQSAMPGSNTGEPSTQGGTENAAAAPYTGQKVTPPAYLQNDPAWQAKLAEMKKEFPGFSEEDFYKMIKGESGFITDAYNPDTRASGLFQFIPSTARGLGTTSEAIRRMSPVQQLEVYQRYLRNANYAGGPFGVVQAAPSTYRSLVGRYGTWSSVPNSTVIYGTGTAAWRANPGWRPSNGGPITKGSIEAYYANQ